MEHYFGNARQGLCRDSWPQEFQFGDFTLDQSRYRLQRGERLLRLEKLPMELLILLVQRRGELVSREEIAERLWGKDVFLDVDHSINTAVRKVRLTLRDDPEKPRFVETVVGKGYRFAAPVICSNGNSNPQVQPLSSPAHAETDSSASLGNAPAVQESGNHVSSPDLTALRPRSPISISLTRWELVLPLAAVGVALAIGVSLLASEVGVLLARSNRGRTISDRRATSMERQRAPRCSRDGQFVAFLSDRDGQMDVWLTQVGSGQFHNLTRGSAPGLANPSLRTLGFSPDGSLVTFWFRRQDGSSSGNISVWAVPTLGGQPKPYLEGAAEFDWSHDGSRLAYHTPGPGDPLFVSDGRRRPEDRPIFTAPAGLHSHFPLWAPDAAFIYFVQGSLPDKMDIWRISPAGGTPERITSHNGRVTYPVLVDRRTLIYLASDADGSGPWLYSMDVERRVPHRLTSGLDRYTSLAASADGRRLVLTPASPKRTIWRLPIAGSTAEASAPARIALTTGTGFSPRLGPDYLLYVSATGTSESIWKRANGADTELWSGQGARVFSGPAISRDGQYIAFSVRQNGRTLLYVMQADGSNARIVTDALELQGAPAWAPDGQSITTAADDPPWRPTPLPCAA